MPSFKITPSSALVTAGQAVTFQATDEANQAINVTWDLTPQVGSLVTAISVLPDQPPQAPGQPPPQAAQPQYQGSSATYVAPAVVQTEQNVAVTAKSATDTGSITISLTPNAISVVPTAVELHAGQKQQFVAMAASGSDAAEPITWILTPQVGVLDSTGLYTAPDLIPDDGTLTITAVSKQVGKQASSRVSLTPEPWRGLGATMLAGYIFLVFWVVFLMIGLWPSEIPNVDALKTDQAQAQSNLDKSKLALQTAVSPKQPPTAGTTTKPTDTTTSAARQEASEELFQQLTVDNQKAEKDVEDATGKLRSATSPKLDTRMVKKINREIDFLCLVLLAGALGSFLHMAQSFSDFTGNRTLKSSWVWWYCFRPFLGAGLAVVLYAALRGGLITVAATPAIKATDLNPYGLVAAAALAGLFSKAATTKLGEIFETAFQSSRGTQTKDPLKSDPQAATHPAKPGTAGGDAAPKAT